MHAQVRLGDVVVPYTFARAKRRSIGFMVSEEGLKVRAPRWTPMYAVEAALQEKSAWILRKLAQSRARQARIAQAQIDWRDGTVLPYLGHTITVVLNPTCVQTCLLVQTDAPSTQYLHVALPETATALHIRDAVHAWLLRQATEYFGLRLNYFAPLLQVRWSKLSLSNARTRWGSARIDGAIRLNWRLMHLSPALIDYVVAHELSHLRVMDHSPRFWDTVRTVVPDFAVLRRGLKDATIPQW